MDSVLKLEHVSKLYGDNLVVNNASFEIEKGCVCGLLGPNGAGKTTIMKIIMNEVKCDNGFVEHDSRLKIRYLQDVPEFYEFYSIKEYLDFILDINNYSKDKDGRINEVLCMLNLETYANKTIRKLSRGLRQKVGIASVIIDEPDVLILDEPVSALDPLGRKEMFDIILSLKGKTTVIFSSHILADIERVCDRVILINKGKIILNNKIEELSLEKSTLLVMFNSRDDLLKVKENIGYPTRFSEKIQDCLEIECDDVVKLQKEVFELLIKYDVGVKCLTNKSESLEEIFLREVRKNA